MVVSLPRERNLKFRLGILFPAMICHLDYTDETHPNSISGFLLRAVPYVVTGPYCHSSPLNRRFFRGKLAYSEVNWHGDTANLRVVAFGQTAAAQLYVMSDAVRIC